MTAINPADDANIPFYNLPAPPGQFLFVPNMGKTDHDEKPALHPPDLGLFNEPTVSSHASASAPFTGGSLHTVQTAFDPTNAHDIKRLDELHVPTLTPIQTHMDCANTAYDPCVDSATFSADVHRYSTASMGSSEWSDVVPREGSIDHNRHDSSRSHVDSPQHMMTARRQSCEKPEPGSARAIYLEKNRQAASKCRTKQKRQQEDLVEAAREVERKNKVLKSEIELLKSDLRDLMNLVGEHHECPDGRLRRYVQLEADRLAAQGDRSPIAELFSSKGGSHRDVASPERC